jgi:peptide-methionine (S)-S-oxide reductase
VIDDCGGQTPIFHAVATNLGAGLPILEYLVHQAGRWIDRDISARLQVFGQATPRAMTVQQYARWTMEEAPPDWPRSSDREIGVLRGLECPVIRDPAFAAAVAAIDAGDLNGLRTLLARHPQLATVRAEESGAFAGPYFARPALLWFIAENPVRTGRMAPNVVAISQAIIDAGATQEDITYTLGLVASGMVPRREGRQMDLIRTLVAANGDPSQGLRSAVAHLEWPAARLLMELGGTLDLPALAGMGDLDGLKRHLREQPVEQPLMEQALMQAARAGHADIISFLAQHANGRVDARNAHGATALHHAAVGGHTSAVEVLLALGACPTIQDAQYHATPAGWAEHAGHLGIAAMLRKAAASREDA